MSKAPERIWITGRFDLGASSNGSWNAHSISNKRADYGEVAYVRADLIPAIEAAAEERGRIKGLREAAEIAKSAVQDAEDSAFAAQYTVDEKLHDIRAEAFTEMKYAILARIPATQSDAEHAQPVGTASQPGEASASSAPAHCDDELVRRGAVLAAVFQVVINNARKAGATAFQRRIALMAYNTAIHAVPATQSDEAPK